MLQGVFNPFFRLNTTGLLFFNSILLFLLLEGCRIFSQLILVTSRRNFLFQEGVQPLPSIEHNRVVVFQFNIAFPFVGGLSNIFSVDFSYIEREFLASGGVQPLLSIEHDRVVVFQFNIAFPFVGGLSNIFSINFSYIEKEFLASGGVQPLLSIEHNRIVVSQFNIVFAFVTFIERT